MPLRKGVHTPKPNRNPERPYTDKEKADAEEYADFYGNHESDPERWQKLYESKLKVIRSE
jgi:hypothetical protein